MEWQSIRIAGASACVIFIVLQKIQKTPKCTFWFWLTRVVPDKVQRAISYKMVVVVVVVYVGFMSKTAYLDTSPT